MDFIACSKHLQFKIAFLYFNQNSIDLFCENCIEDNEINPEELQFDRLIHIQTLIQQPEVIFKKLNLEKRVKSFLKTRSTTFNQGIKELEKQIQGIKDLISHKQEELNNCTKKLEYYRKQIIQEILTNEINFQEIKQTIFDVVTRQESTNSDVNFQLKQKLNTQFSQLLKDQTKQINKFVSDRLYQISITAEQEIYQLTTLDEINNKLINYQNDEYKLLTKIFPQVSYYVSSTLFDPFQQLKIISLIKQRSEKDIQDIKLIYLGSKDGFNGQSFWQKVNGKSNLLMIFKSKSNYVFGGYSPCQWQSNIGGYVKDSTYSSFLFSQTHNEIYQIKQNQIHNAIKCKYECGPIFGVGHDIYVAANGFQAGHSNLGQSYQWDKSENKQSAHLFGQLTPDIQECEIHEIVFK